MHSPRFASDSYASESDFEFGFEPEFEFVFEDTPGGGCETALVLEGFEPGGYRLLPHHYQPLQAFIEQLRSNPPEPDKELVLIGHGDDPAGGPASSGLGLHRALEVRRFLQPLWNRMVSL